MALDRTTGERQRGVARGHADRIAVESECLQRRACRENHRIDAARRSGRDLNLIRRIRQRRGLEIHHLRQIFDAGLALVAQRERLGAGVALLRGDHQVQFADRGEEQVGLVHVVAHLIREIGLHFREAIVGKLKALRHRLRRLVEHLLLRGVGRIDGELTRRSEKSGHGVVQTVATGRRGDARIAHAGNRLA